MLFRSHSFPQRERKYCDRLRQIFGSDCIVLSKVHAKVCTVRNEDWDVVISGSMNLNRNPRWEHFEIENSRAKAQFFGDLVDELRRKVGAGWDPAESDVERAFKEAGMDETNALVEKWLQQQAEGRGAGRNPKPAPAPPPPPDSFDVPRTAEEFAEGEFRLASSAHAAAMQDHDWKSVAPLAKLKAEIWARLEQLRPPVEQAVSPTEAAAALVEMTLKAPIKVQWEIFRRLSEANPNWKEDI